MAAGRFLSIFTGRGAGSPGGRALDFETILETLEQALPAKGNGSGHHAPGRRDLTEATALIQVPSGDPSIDGRLQRLLQIVGAFPDDERLYLLFGRLVERSRHKKRSHEIWRVIHRRFPSSEFAFARLIRWTSRDLGVEAAHAAISAQFPALPDSPRDLRLYAAGFIELNEYDLADSACDSLLQKRPDDEASYVQYAQSLVKRSEFERAVEVLQAGKQTIRASTPAINKDLQKIQKKIDDISLRLPEIIVTGRRTTDVALNNLVDEILTAGRPVRPPSTFVGSVLLMTGSLGAGGAERQLVETATALQNALVSGEPVGDSAVFGPLSVFCRSLSSRPGASFFLKPLVDRGISVSEFSNFLPYGGQERRSLLLPYARYLEFLSPQISVGTIKLVDAINFLSPQIAHIWQDGMVLEATIAALIAGVPRIILSTRTMPPPDRLGRNKPEYVDLYRAVLRAPGVVLTANSRRAANRYAEWLSVDPASIHVISNGVTLPSPDPAPSSTEMWERFAAQTAGARFTVGTVIRFDENKRPLVWLDAAARVEGARFVLVGDGPLRDRTIERARELGIADRVLFPGRVSDVGFWLSKFDAFMLLSHVEGLPNVLIEAQLAGVPVITTPAGGSVETMLPNETGFVLPSERVVDPADAAALLQRLFADADRWRMMSQRAREWGSATFSVRRMAEATVEQYLGIHDGASAEKRSMVSG